MDFGCGSKPYRSLFDVQEYIGVDIKNQGHSHKDENVDVYYDGKRIPIKNNYFDYVVSVEVFEHIFNLPDILVEINRVLKPEGKIFFTCPFVWIEHEVPNDYARYTKYALRDLLKKSGFEIEYFEKGGNFVITIGQLSIVYLNKILKNNFFISRFALAKKIFLFIQATVIFSTNVFFLTIDLFLPSIKQLYLVNIVVAKKLNKNIT